MAQLLADKYQCQFLVPPELLTDSDARASATAPLGLVGGRMTPAESVIVAVKDLTQATQRRAEADISNTRRAARRGRPSIWRGKTAMASA